MRVLNSLIVRASKVKKKWVAVASVALLAALLFTLFPIHLEMDGQSGVSNIGMGRYRIIIGNQVNAQSANYTCDGINDDVEFQAAMDALPAIGGELFILAGTYTWNTATTVTRAIDNVSIIGVGASVNLTGDGVTALFTAGGDNWLFSNLGTDDGGLDMGATSYWQWLNIHIGATFYSVESPDDPIGSMTEHGNEYHNPDFATQVAFDSLNGTVISLAGDIATLQGDLDTLEARVDSINSTVIGYGIDISNLQGDVSDLQDDLDTLEGRVDSINSTLIGYGIDISTLQGDVSDLQGDVSDLQGDVSDLQGDISDLQSLVSGVAGNVTTLQGDVSDLQGDVSDLQGDVSTLQGDVSDLQTDLDTLEAAFAAHEDATDVHGVWMDYQGRRISILNPYQDADNRYKVQLHTHTTGSDGVDTPTALMNAYKAAGYDAVAITDHDVLTADPAVGGILYIPGVEETYFSGINYVGHFVNLNAASEKAETDAQDIIDAILLDNALVDVAHPWDVLPMSTDLLQALYGFQLLEIANGQVIPEVEETRWTNLLDRGWSVWALGVDDCHDISSSNFDLYFVEIIANGLTTSALMESVRDGNFYVRQTGAPQMTITLSTNNVTCNTSAAADIEFIGRNGLVLQSEENVTTSQYTIQGWEQYVRVRLVDHATGTYYSWSQPIWLLYSPENKYNPVDISCSAYTTVQVAIPNSTWTTVSLNAEYFDTDGIHDTAVLNKRLTCKTPGKYIVGAKIHFASSATGVRCLAVMLNGSGSKAAQYQLAIGDGMTTVITAEAVVSLVFGDYIEINCYQSSGGSLNVTSATLWMAKIPG